MLLSGLDMSELFLRSWFITLRFVSDSLFWLLHTIITNRYICMSPCIATRTENIRSIFLYILTYGTHSLCEYELAIPC